MPRLRVKIPIDGRKLKALREERGWNTYEAQAHLGITRRGIRRLELLGDKAMVRRQTLKWMAWGFGMPVEELIERLKRDDPEQELRCPYCARPVRLKSGQLVALRP